MTYCERIKRIEEGIKERKRIAEDHKERCSTSYQDGKIRGLNIALEVVRKEKNNERRGCETL